MRGPLRAVLCVAEKPSICNAIAAALARGAEMRTTGRTPPLHEFEGDFRGETVAYRVTSVLGHLYELDFPEGYNDWDAIDPLELFGAPVEKRATKGAVVRALKEAALGCAAVVLWLDCDREGENICYEVLGAVSSSLAPSTS